MSSHARRTFIFSLLLTLGAAAAALPAPPPDASSLLTPEPSAVSSAAETHSSHASTDAADRPAQPPMATDKRKPALPEPLFWAYGWRNAAHLASYRDLGLNTIYVDLPLVQPGPDPAVRRLIRAAAAAGLHVIVGIPTGLGRQQAGERDPTSSYNERYVSALEEFVGAAVRAYRDEPAVIAWGTQHDPAAYMTYCDRDFQRHLEGYYASVDELNETWGAQFLSFRSVRMADAEPDSSQPFAIGRRSLAVAEYKRAAFAELHNVWLTSIRKFDDSRPIFTGRLRLYRSLAAVPTDYSCIVSDATGAPVVTDLHTQALERIAIARRAGLCEAVPCLRLPPGGEGFGPRVRQGLLRRWLTLAAVQGARGVAFASWERLYADTQELHQALRSLLTDPACTGLFTIRPKSSAAILYEPYVRVTTHGRSGFYGYLDAPGDLEPATLLGTCRRPSAYGTVDVLALEDIEKIDLARYGVILAPRAFHLPESAQQAVESYVEDGGAFVADLGLGVFQTGSWTDLPPRMMDLFGIEEFVSLKNTYRGGWQAGNGFVGAETAEFPSLRRRASTSGTVELHGGKAAFKGWHGMVTPAWETELILVLDTEAKGNVPKPGSPKRLPRRRRAAKSEARVSATSSGVLLSRRGRGIALYATTRLWEAWPPSDPLYQAFHKDLFARRANVVLQTREGLYPRSILAGATESGVWAYNTTDVGQRVRLVAGGAHSRIHLDTAARVVAAFRRPGGMPSGSELLSLHVPAHTAVQAHALPIAVEPFTDNATTIGHRYGPDGVEFEIAGADAELIPQRGGKIRLYAARAVTVRVTVESGTYQAPPGSMHRVTISRRGQSTPPVVLELEADEKGRVRFTRPFVRHIIRIEPIERGNE